jgi:predicted O-linked N-acetylglucosamine transferase (SPINDLY family)
MARVHDIIAQADTLVKLGKHADAEKALRNGLRQFPAEGRMSFELATLLFNVGRVQEATPFAQRAASLSPREPLAWMVLAKCLIREGKVDECIAACQKAIAFAPNLADAHNTIAVACLQAQRSEPALIASRRALELAPNDITCQATFSAALADHAQPDEAYEVSRRASDAHPTHKPLAVAAVNATLYSGLATPLDRLALARRAGELIALPARMRPLPPGTRLAQNSRPRLGIVSYDFRQHSCAYFLRPLLQHLPGQGFDIHVFSLLEKGDALTQRFRDMLTPPHAFHDCGRADLRAIAEQVRAANIDLLLEVGGFAGGSGIEVLTYRPAPVQATWLAYPGTTGVPGVDFRIVDAHTDPPADGERDPQSFYTERLVRMDRCFICYDHASGPPEAVATARLHAMSQRASQPITFGSFNAPTKISQACLRLWASVLLAVPDSRILLKGTSLGAGEAPRFIRETLAGLGVSADRVECMGKTASPAEHLRLYERIDVALDTFPYHGTTTTCEALLSGVPVVTLAGPDHASRVGVSLLHTIGRSEWIAYNMHQFAAITSGLARDRATLVESCKGLRANVLASPLCDGLSFARSFASVLRTLIAQVAERRGS